MLCPNCHSQVENTMRFCPYCGYKLPGPSRGNQAAFPHSINTPPHEAASTFYGGQLPPYEQYPQSPNQRYSTAPNKPFEEYPSAPRFPSAQTPNAGLERQFDYPPVPSALSNQAAPSGSSYPFPQPDYPSRPSAPPSKTYNHSSSSYPEQHAWQTTDLPSAQRSPQVSGNLPNEYVPSSSARSSYSPSAPNTRPYPYGVGSSAQRASSVGGQPPRGSILLPPEESEEDEDYAYLYEKETRSHKGLIISLIFLLLVIGGAAALQLTGIIHLQDLPQMVSSLFQKEAVSSEPSSLAPSQTVDSATAYSFVTPVAQTETITGENGKWSLSINGENELKEAIEGETPPSAGNTYLLVHVLIKNNATDSAEKLRCNNYDFTLANSDFSSILNPISMPEYPGALTLGQIEGGKEKAGVIIFEIPANAKNYSLYYRPADSNIPQAAFSLSIPDLSPPA